MNWALLVFLLGFVSIFLLRIPIALGMLMTSTFYCLVAGIDISLVAEKVLTNLFSKYIIMAVPLFVFTANVMNTAMKPSRVIPAIIISAHIDVSLEMTNSPVPIAVSASAGSSIFRLEPILADRMAIGTVNMVLIR